MAHTVTDVKRFKQRDGLRRAIVNLTISGTDDYDTATGGWVVTPALLGFTGIIDIRPPIVQLDGSTTPVLHALVAQPINNSVNWGLRAYVVSSAAEFADDATGFDGEAIRLDVLGY